MTCSTAPVIDTRLLVKEFGKTRALDGLDLQVRPGAGHGFLGPNGAGKSTTPRVLLGLIRPMAGPRPDPPGHSPCSTGMRLSGRTSPAVVSSICSRDCAARLMSGCATSSSKSLILIHDRRSGRTRKVTDKRLLSYAEAEGQTYEEAKTAAEALVLEGSGVIVLRTN